MLKAGGSAVDALIAANAALGLMEPTGNGIGGDLFAIVWDPETQQLYGYNGSGRSPMGRSFEQMEAKIAALKASGAMPASTIGIPSHGSLSVTVPGAVDGWFALHDRWGQLPMKQVLADPIRYAEEGFPLSPVIAAGFEGNRRRFSQVRSMIEELANAENTYFKGWSRASMRVKSSKIPDLGRTLRAIGEGGRAAFYEESIAVAMDEYFGSIGADLNPARSARARGRVGDTARCRLPRLYAL